MSEPQNYQCQDCGHAAPEGEFPEAIGLLRCLQVGDVFTDKECPECGALAHPVKPAPPKALVAATKAGSTDALRREVVENPGDGR